MIKLDDLTKENIREHNLIWSPVPDHSHRILINGDSGSGKTYSLFNLIRHQPYIEKINLC